MNDSKNKHEDKLLPERKHKKIIEFVLSKIINDDKLAQPIYINGMNSEEQSTLFGSYFPLQYIWNEHQRDDGKIGFSFSLNGRVVGHILEEIIPRKSPDFIEVRDEILKVLHSLGIDATIRTLEKLSLKPSLAFKQYDYKDLISLNTLNINILNYDGAHVSRELLEEAIDFMISLEPDPESLRASEEYEENLDYFKSEIHQVKQIIRQFGEQIHPRTLENMQTVFYSVTNSKKYLASAIHCSVAYSCLESGWNGIGPWQQ